MRSLTAFLVAFLVASVLRADPPKPKPESMPVDAAQDLEYQLYRIARVSREMEAKYNEELKRRTGKEQDKVNEICKRYGVQLADDHGQPVDKVDFDTGKITRKSAPPKK